MVSIPPAWWAEEEDDESVRGSRGLLERARHIEACTRLLSTLAPRRATGGKDDGRGSTTMRRAVPLGLLAELNQRALWARGRHGKYTQKATELVTSRGSQPLLKSALEKSARGGEKRRLVYDGCSRCGLPFDRPSTSRGIWRMEARESKDSSMRLVAVCNACGEVHGVGKLPRMEAALDREQDEEDNASSAASTYGGSNASNARTPAGKGRRGVLMGPPSSAGSTGGGGKKGSASSSTPWSSSSAFSTPAHASPMLFSAAAKKSAKKKRGSQLSRLLRETEKDEGESEGGGGGLASFLSSLS